MAKKSLVKSPNATSISGRTPQVLLAAITTALAFTAAHATAASVGDVFVIGMENHNFTQPNPTSGTQQLLNNPAAPFLNSLITPGNPNAAQVSYASHYYNAGAGVHPSETNYIWSEAGTNFNASTNTTVLTDGDPTAGNKNIFTNVPHLTAQMNSAGITWNNYQEDYQISSNSTPTGGSPLVSKSGTSTTITNPYNGTNEYGYAVKHNPMAFFSDTATQNVKTFDTLRSNLTADTASNSNPVNNFGRYNWITPDLYNEMHTPLPNGFTYHGTAYTGDQSAVAAGDSFLATIIPQIMATTAYKNNGAIVIWFDESEGGDTTSYTLPEIVISPLAKGNAFNSSITYSHTSDLKTMEEIFQLGSYLNNAIPSSETNTTGGYNTLSASSDLSNLFVSGTIPTSPIPEPTSLALLSLGSLFLIRRR